MEQPVVLKPSLVKKFEEAMLRDRAVFFSAPCGFGKTVTARQLLEGRTVCMRSAAEPDFSLPDSGGEWQVLLIDDLQFLTSPRDQEALLALMRDNPRRRFVLLSRGALPPWLTPFRIAGVMTVLGVDDLALDRESADKLLQLYGTSCAERDLDEILSWTKGCAVVVVLLAQRLAKGETYSPAMADRVRRDLFFYYEEFVLHRLDLPIQQLLLDLSPFPSFGPELARMVSGNS